MTASLWLFEWLSRYFAPAGYYDPLFYQCADLLPRDRGDADASQPVPPVPAHVQEAPRIGPQPGLPH